MKITISTLPGNDANFGTWLQFISLYKYLEDKFKATPSIRSRPFIWDKMLCKDVFNSSFEYFNFNICDPKNSDYILIGSDVVLGIKSDWYSDKWFTSFIKFDGIDDKKKIVISGGGIGKDKLLDSMYAQFFNSIEYVSFREKSSYESNIDSQHPNWTYTIDPALLHDQEFYKGFWRKPDIELPEQFDVIYTPHDFCKPLNVSKDVIELYNNPKIGIREFLWMVGNCKTIYTTSYHGTIFGILFNRRIVNDNPKQFKTRELFNLFGIDIGEGNEIIYDLDMLNPILEKERERVFQYLSKALNVSVRIPVKLACYSKNNFVRDMSSSGGFSGIVANQVLCDKGVVYGASYVDGFKHVKTIRVDNISDYYKNIAKSKYSYCQDCDFNLVRKDLDENREVLFTGCPCQVKRLKEFLGKEYDNLTTIDLKCRGYSNPKCLEQFIDKIEAENNAKVVQLDMRTNHKSLTKVTFENGCIETYNNVSSIFINNKNLLDECKLCNMHWSNNVSDITIGDFWQFKTETMDQRFSPNNGTNIVVINNRKGINMVNRVKNQLEVMYL